MYVSKLYLLIVCVYKFLIAYWLAIIIHIFLFKFIEKYIL